MMATMTQQQLTEMTPRTALQTLLDGNARYVERRMNNRDLIQQVGETSEGQYPFAVVLGCIDSRVPPEMVFDVGIGDIFAARVAGNIANDDILGSMEFACGAVGSKLILVLGHTSCGAVKGAYDNVELGHLTGLVGKIKPAVEWAQREQQVADDDLDAIARKNVELTVAAIKQRSTVLNELANSGQIEIVGGMYDVSSGRVTLI